MKAYFDRTEPYYLTLEPSFEAVEVDVEMRIIDLLQNRKVTLVAMENAIEQAGAPEDSAQDLTDYFVSLLDGEDNG